MSASDWTPTKVRDVIAESFSGPSPTCEERNTEGEEWGVLKTTCATVEHGWDWTKHKVLPKSFWGNERSLIQAGDTVITKAGPRHRVAVSAFVDFVPPRILVSGKMVGLRPNPAAIYPGFLALALRDVRTQTFLDERTTGMAESQVNFDNEALMEAPLFLPPMIEQQAIAEALSDADALVESLDALIAKKRDMKQAAMQQLLTGRTRLPGFTEEWTLRQVGDCLTIEHGRNQSQIVDTAGQFPILATGGEIGRTNAFLHDGPSVLIGRKGTIDRPQYMATPFWTVDTLFYSRIRTGFVAKFLYFKFLMVDWRSLNEASGVPSLNASTIERVEISVPQFEEQQAIAGVLSDMDAEIDALVAQREKAELVKQGMMQELLSGRVRLV